VVSLPVEQHIPRLTRLLVVSLWVLCDAQEVLPLFLTTDAQQQRLAATCCNGLPKLVATVLSARKRAREWKQIEYSRMVRTVLLISQIALRALDTLLLDPGCRMRAATALVSCDAIAKVAAAATEVSQLLLAGHDCGQQDGQQQQHQQLKQLACGLLAWWVAAHRVCATTQQQQQLGPGQDRPPVLRNFNAAQSLPRAAELAAALAQTLSADSPQEQIAGLLDAAGYLCRHQPVQPLKNPKDLLQLFSSRAYLQLSLAMLLLHSYSAQQAASTTSSTCSSSSSAGASSSSSSAGASSSSSSAGASSSSSSAGASSSCSSRSCGGEDRATEHEPEQQEQQQQEQQQQLEQLAKITKQLWQGAGLAPALLPRCAAALASQLPQGLPPAEQCGSGQQLQSQCQKYGYGFVDMTIAVNRSLGMTAMCANKPPQQGQSSVAAGAHTKQRPAAPGGPTFDLLPRQYQQLLQATVWLLPQFLLQSVLLCFEGNMTLTEVAADCAQNVLFWWCISGWYPDAATAAATAQRSGSSSSSSSCRTASRATTDTSSAVPGPLQQLVPPLVDVWLLLTKRVLLQPDGLIHTAAVTEQYLPVGSELAKQVRGSAYCGCLRHEADARAQKVSASCEIQCRSCVTLSCEAQYALGTLLAALHQTAITSTGLAFDLKVPGHDWREHADSVALVLEVVARKLLPHYTLCSSSSNSGSSSSNSGSSSSNSGSSSCGSSDSTIAPGPGSCGSGSGSSTLSESHSTANDVTPGLHAANAAPYLRFAFSRCMSEVLSGHGLVVLVAQHCKHRQLFSLLASVFKLWRCQPQPQQQLSVLNSAVCVAACVAKSVVKTLSLQRDVEMTHTAGVPPLRASLSSWVLLLALYLSTAGLYIVTEMREDAPVSCTARHLQRKLQGMSDTLRLLRVARDALQCAHKQWAESAINVAQKQHAEQLPAMSGAQQPDTQQQKQGQPQLQSQQQCQQKQLQPQEPPAPSAVADVVGPGCKALEKLLSAITDKNLQDCQDVLSAAAAHAATLAGPTAVSMASSNVFVGSSNSSGLCCWVDAPTPAEETRERHEEVLAATNSIKAAQTLEQCWQATRGVKLLQRQAVSLRLAGVRLSYNLPVAWLCNNVYLCRNMAGASEQQLVGGSSCVCGSCKVAR